MSTEKKEAFHWWGSLSVSSSEISSGGWSKVNSVMVPFPKETWIFGISVFYHAITFVKISFREANCYMWIKFFWHKESWLPPRATYKSLTDFLIFNKSSD